MALKDIFTEKDGVSVCPVRVGFVLTILWYLGGTCHDLYAVTDFKFMEHAKDWAEGVANILGLGGASIAGKNYTEKE